MMHWGYGLRETIHGGGASPQQPGDGFKEPEPKLEDTLGRPCFQRVFGMEEEAWQAVAQLSRKVYNTQVSFSSWSSSGRMGLFCTILVPKLCALFWQGAVWSGSVFAFNEKIPL